VEAALIELPSGWEAAAQLHKLKRALPARLRREVERRAVAEILQRARALLRHTARPRRTVREAFPAVGELDLDAMLEETPPDRPLVVSRQESRDADVVAILDMSLSMTGPKIALTALAAAVLKLRLEHVAVVSFDTVAHRLVPLTRATTVAELVRRILAVPALGYTHISAGLRAGLAELRTGRHRERVGVIMTDGVANIGRDPVSVAARYPRLHVIAVGAEEPRGERCCREMARAGRGERLRAETWEALPRVTRELVRRCFR